MQMLFGDLLLYFFYQDCLGIVYTVYMEGLGVSMETLIGNMVGYVQVPPAGGPQVRFSIGAGDRQAVQPPQSNTIPVTNTSVYSLFTQLGRLLLSKTHLNCNLLYFFIFRYKERYGTFLCSTYRAQNIISQHLL